MYHLIRMLPGARRREIYLKISVFSIGYCVTVLVHYHNLNKAETQPEVHQSGCFGCCSTLVLLLKKFN